MLAEKMKAANLPAPVFQNRRNGFVVILYNRPLPQKELQKKTGLTKKKHLQFCRVPRSRQEIAGYLGITSVSYTLSQYVQPLINAGKIKLTLPEKPKSVKQRYITVQSDSLQHFLDCR